MSGLGTTGSERWHTIVLKLSLCEREEHMTSLMKEIIGRKYPLVLSFVNAHAANLMWKNLDFFRHLESSDLLLRDGIGMRFLLLLLKRRPGLNLNGTDFIPALLEKLPRSTHLAIYGTEEPYLSGGSSRVREMGIAAIDIDHGFHADSYYVERMRATSPDVVLLAMGMPKQERIAVALRHAAGSRPILIINGGAVIDFLAGRFPRAPRWMRVVGIEWLFRLITEPARLWRRYVLGNILFLWRAAICWSIRSTRQSKL